MTRVRPDDDQDPVDGVRAAVASRVGGPAAAAAATAHPPSRPRGRRDREGPTLGTRRGVEGAVRRGGRGPGTLRTRHPQTRPQGFPTGKTFDAWDPEASSIPAPTQQALRTLEWVHRRENLVVCGPSGTGKTFLLEALGQQAVEQGLKVAWFTLEDLGVLLRRHRADDTVSKAITRVLRADVVVVDDIGLLPVAADAAEGLYRLVDAAYEKRSIAISSNLHPSGFDELMPKTLATATVDRLLHHAHVCQTSPPGPAPALPRRIGRRRPTINPPHHSPRPHRLIGTQTIKNHRTTDRPSRRCRHLQRRRVMRRLSIASNINRGITNVLTISGCCPQSHKPDHQHPTDQQPANGTAPGLVDTRG